MSFVTVRRSTLRLSINIEDENGKEQFQQDFMFEDSIVPIIPEVGEPWNVDFGVKGHQPLRVKGKTHSVTLNENFAALITVTLSPQSVI